MAGLDDILTLWLPKVALSCVVCLWTMLHASLRADVYSAWRAGVEASPARECKDLPIGL